jgi:hypothetical protein
MPEGPSRGKGFRAGAPLRIGATTLLAIERIAVRTERGDAWRWFSAVLEPHALVVRDAQGIRALGIGAAPVLLEDLRRDVPDLDRLLDGAG